MIDRTISTINGSSIGGERPQGNISINKMTIY